MSHHGRNKSSASDVSFARNKLDGVLQTLMDKTEESSEASDDDGFAFESDNYKESGTSSRASSKRSLGSKTPRKRKRKDDENTKDINNGTSIYVMKLFDRSVDLAKFNETSPLYPIARAWVYNDPFQSYSRTRFAHPVVDDDNPVVEEQDESKQTVYELPLPLKIKTESGAPAPDLRIPPCPEKRIIDKDNFNLDSQTSIATGDLLADHMVKWKQVRQSWKEAAMVNETRYKDSLSIIKSLKVVYE